MYDLSKRVIFEGNKPATVANVIAELAKLDPETRLVCCGDPGFVLHVDVDKNIASIDSEPLDGEYETEEEE